MPISRTHLLSVSLTVLLSACGSDSTITFTPPGTPPAGPAVAITAAQLARIDAYVQAQMSHRHVPGVALVVTLNGKPVLAKGYGVADTATGATVTPDTLFPIGSITKQFTATAILLLAQDGRLRLDDPITLYLPTAPAAWRDITLRHLLNHTSGLVRDLPDALVEPLLGKQALSLDTQVALASDAREAAPGVRYKYSNLGYHLLGFVVEKVSGQHFAAFLRQRVFDPIGMNTAGPVTAALAPGSVLATGYTWTGAAFDTASGIMLTPGLMEGEGALRMSARDLAKWDAGLSSERFLSRASLAEMQAPARLADGSMSNYGFGWIIDAVNRHPFTWHDGEFEGFRSQFARHGDEGLAVVVLTNATDAPVAGIAARVSAILAPQLDWRIGVDPTPRLGALVRALIEEARRGALVVDERFAPALREALSPDVIASIEHQFGELGTIEQFGYLDDVTVQGVTTQRYLVRGKLDQVMLRARLDAAGRLETLLVAEQ